MEVLDYQGRRPDEEDDQWGRDNPEIVSAFEGIQGYDRGSGFQSRSKQSEPTAEDGQGFSSQSSWTKAAFRTRYGDQGAAAAWAQEHNQELGNRRNQLGGSPGSPTSTPDRPSSASPVYQQPVPWQPSVGVPFLPGRASQQSVQPRSSLPLPSATQPSTISPSQVTPEASPTRTTGPQTASGFPSDPLGTVVRSEVTPEDEILVENVHTGYIATIKRKEWGPKASGVMYTLEDGWQFYADVRVTGTVPANTIGLGNTPSFGTTAPTDYIPPSARAISPAQQAAEQALARATPPTPQTVPPNPPGVNTYVPSGPSAPRSEMVTVRHRTTGETARMTRAEWEASGKHKGYLDLVPDSSLPTTTPGAPTPTPTPQSANIEIKPVTLLAEASIKKRGGSLEETPEESRRILRGIGTLVRGEEGGAAYEGYLNDIARLAWAQEEQRQGRDVDPMTAPRGYIESWKDAFYGSDASVPFVKELDQQLIDAAVTRTPTGQRVFDWRRAYGPTGENGLISTQIASNDCGPNAFSTILRSRGYNADPAQAFSYAKKYGYHNGDQFNGPHMFAKMLRDEAGLDAQASGVDWNVIDKELDAGRPVALSSSKHYYVVSSYKDGPNGRVYYTGATGTTVSNPAWSRPDQMVYGGASPDVMITTAGEVNQNSRVVKDLGLRPPGPREPSRADLTQQDNASSGLTPYRLAGSTGQRVRYNRPLDDDTARLTVIYKDSPVGEFIPLIKQAAIDNNTDPYLIGAIIDEESQGRVDARSRSGAEGLMQLMPDTARGLGVQDSMNPRQNVNGGAKYIRQLLTKYDGNLDLALAAYNAGPGYVDSLGGDTSRMYPETKAYVERVKARYRSYRAA